MKRILLPLALATFSGSAIAQNVLFDFDDAPLHTPLPIDITKGGITAHFWATPYYNYSIQRADTMGFTPIGFAGNCIYPNSVFKDDLNVSFDKSLDSFSILYAVQELDCDSSATMRVSAYLNDSYVGTNTQVAQPNQTWPTATLSFTWPTLFNRVVVHYDSPPPTGGDYGVIFMADNMQVNAVPEPTSLAAIGIGLTLFRRRRR